MGIPMADLLNIEHYQFNILAQFVLAMLLGGVIGYNRERANKAAGLRTHMFVAAAATLLVALCDTVVRHYSSAIENQLIQTDPIRMIEAVITGVSFLGAGTIIRHARSNHIEGLTTAASLLLTAVIGVAVALSEFLLALVTTVLVVIALWGANYRAGQSQNQSAAIEEGESDA